MDLLWTVMLTSSSFLDFLVMTGSSPIDFCTDICIIDRIIPPMLWKHLFAKSLLSNRLSLYLSILHHA